MADDIAAVEITRGGIRTPRAAAVAGIAFSLLLTTAFVLIRQAVPSDPNDAGDWLTNSSKRNAVVLALNLLPFAGIAFLWFIGVVRDRIGHREDRFFATVFLGSGLLFIAMLFASAASASSLLLIAEDGAGVATAGVWSFGRRTTYTLLNIYAMRMAAVFTISTTTIVARLKIVRRGLILFGFATGAVLLVAVGFVPWLELIFPAWVFALSISILVATTRSPSDETRQSPTIA
jgi:MFS family permease